MGKLLDRLREEKRQEDSAKERRAVSELVGTPKRADHLTGFAAACRDSQEQAFKTLAAQIERTLRADPALISTPALEAQFRNENRTVPAGVMSEIIRKVKNGD